MGFAAMEYAYLFDKDFLSIQNYIQQFNDGIATLDINEIKSDKDLVQQLTLQIKMYGTKIIELYEALDQCSSTQIPNSEREHEIHRLEQEKKELEEKIQELQEQKDNNEIVIMTQEDNNWAEIEGALQEAFATESNMQEGFELLQTLDYKINTRNIYQLCVWLGASNRKKDSTVENIWKQLPRESNELRELKPASSFFDVTQEISQYLKHSREQVVEQHQQIIELQQQPQILLNKIEYLNQQIAEAQSICHGEESSIIELQGLLKKERTDKQKYMRDLEIVCTEYDALRAQGDSFSTGFQQGTIKDQLEDIKNDLSRFREESILCNLEEMERLKDQMQEKSRRLDDSFVEITYLKQKINDQQLESKAILEEEEGKWERKHTEMLEQFKKQIQDEKTQEAKAKQLTEEKKKFEAEISNLKKEIQQSQNNLRELKTILNEERSKQRQQSALEMEEYKKQQLINAEERDREWKIKCQQWEDKCQELIAENERLQEGFGRCSDDIQKKTEIINSLQDELSVLHHHLSQQQELSSQLQNDLNAIESQQLSSDAVLETENNNLKQALRLTDKELTECKHTIQQMNVQFEKFKVNQMEKIRSFSITIEQLKDQGENQLIMKENEITQIKQKLDNSEELIRHYEEIFTIQEEKQSYQQQQQQQQSRKNLATQDLQSSLGDSSSSRMSLSNQGRSCNVEELLNRLTKYKRQIIKLKEKQSELTCELESSRKNFTELMQSSKELEAKYVQIQTESAKLRLFYHQTTAKDGELAREEFQKLQDKLGQLEIENGSLRNGIFSKDSTFKELEKLMAVNEDLLQEIENLRGKIVKKDSEIAQEKNITKQQIVAATKKIDELQKKVEEQNKSNHIYSTTINHNDHKQVKKTAAAVTSNNKSSKSIRCCSTQRSRSSSHRTVFSDITKDIQENQINTLHKEDLHNILQQKDQEINRLSSVVKTLLRDEPALNSNNQRRKQP